MIGGAFEPDYVEPFLRRLAAQVYGTEAFAFELSDLSTSVRPQLICHIRPDGAPPEALEAARNAVIQIIEPCIRERKDGVISISDGQPSPAGSQYCLASIIYDQADRRKPIGVFAIITRCKDDQEAKARLSLMQGRSQPIAPSPAIAKATNPATTTVIQSRSLGVIVAGVGLMLFGAMNLTLISIRLVQSHGQALSPWFAFVIVLSIASIAAGLFGLRRRRVTQ